MNRVFSADAAIDLDTLPAGGEDHPAPAPHRPVPPSAGLGGRGLLPPAQGPGRSPQPAPKTSPPLTVVLLAALGGVGLVGALSGVLLMRQWAGLQQALSQERNLLLVERLRALGPATAPANAPTVTATPPAPVLGPVPSLNPQNLAGAGDLPPPPPEEPWMAQLSELPARAGRAPLLRVPVSPRLPAAAPPASPAVAPQPAGRGGADAREHRPSGPLPQLVGLVGAPGRAGTAIFQVGDTSTNVNVGEAIGSSGWRLRAADAESALIERGTEVRRISIVSGG